ncbi:hypothetical protein X748_30625 [Mesorhizobium sp. LNJC386A00]|nr:hypothetical protein X748_30625 [Mesorhizobium sp. LNJC386A00]ESZ24354.1 hypothetical protein X732_33460 [Mesorhizobium sp. L2C066B000]
MTFGVLQRVKEHFWPTGQKETQAPMGPAHFNDSEIASLRQQLKANSDSALKIRAARGHKVNPRILAARKAGANV